MGDTMDGVGDRSYGRVLVSYLLEWVLFSAADLVSVATESAAESVRRRIGAREKVFVTPTYVDTEVFDADAAAKTIDDALVLVGRLEPPKSVLNLVKACHASAMGLHIVGIGSLESTVIQLAAAIGADVRINRGIPNDQSAKLFKSYKHYALTSIYEGLPKSLIEAMSSEMVCIGTDVPGISDLLTEGVTGFLSRGFDEGAIAATIERARSARRTSTSRRQPARSSSPAIPSRPTSTVTGRQSIAGFAGCWARHQEASE